MRDELWEKVEVGASSAGSIYLRFPHEVPARGGDWREETACFWISPDQATQLVKWLIEARQSPLLLP